MAARQIEPGAVVRVTVSDDGNSLVIGAGEMQSRTAELPTVLLVDDNRDLLLLFERQLASADWTVLTAETGRQCEFALRQRIPDAVVLDYLLPDANGVDLACSIRSTHSRVAVVIATGAELTPEDHERCVRNAFPILRKPFLAEELTKLVRACLTADTNQGKKSVPRAAARSARTRGAS